MKAGSNKECSTVNPVCDGEGGFVIFKALKEGEIAPEQDCESKRLNSLFSFSFYDAVMCPCDSYTGGK